MLRHSSVSKDPNFLSWLAVVAWVESRGNPAAVSEADAYGLLQVTSEGANEASAACHLPILHELAPYILLEPEANVKYGSCLLKFYHKEAEEDGVSEAETWKRTLVLYNSGYKGLLRYKKNGTMVLETQAYVKAALTLKEFCDAQSK